MKKNVRISLIAICLIVFLISGGVVLKDILEQRAGKQAYEDAKKAAGLDALENAQSSADTDKENELNPVVIPEELKNLDLEIFKNTNKDVMGWIIIPGADISYPLLDGEDNTYYLTHTWEKKWNQMGSIFLEETCKNDLSEFNTIIYGHNMRTTTMFSNLKKYLKKSFWEGAQEVYIAQEDRVRIYKVFAAYEVSVTGHAFWIDIEDEELKQRFIDNSLEMAEYDTEIVPEVSDYILTLSTCTGNGHEKRMIVQAVLAGEELLQ